MVNLRASLHGQKDFEDTYLYTQS